MTSTAPSAAPVSVRGSTFVGDPASMSPRYPVMLGTPDQSSLAVIWPALDQFCVRLPEASE